jgi:hypothetical protein
MESIILVIVTSAMCIWSFTIGVKVGQSVQKGEKVEMPVVNPMNVYKEHKAKQEAKMERDKLETILANIENYDGTSNNQEDVPGR